MRLAGRWLLFLALLALLSGLVQPARAGQKAVRAKLAGRELNLSLADDLASRVKGLGDRDNLAWNEGMLFVYTQAEVRSFWMKDMKMSIDIIWILQGRVTGLAARMPPPRSGERPATTTSPGPVDLVLEVNAGWSKAAGLKIGDEFMLLDPLPPAKE